MKIYHNPRCSKSRKGLQYLEDKGCNFEVVKYLSDGLSEKELSKKIPNLEFETIPEIIKTRKQPIFTGVFKS